ncbi:hypothetical protein P7K49_023640 [Saguinus oedipus]|uniref:STAR protein homodimerisation region domain-containing protein n=1 Tax=Saguinus oedipus TaxID=9490 RepID=A0ABQ9UMC5_SAGOE|nr:hypothetical protein P7K49_023640 [Saguinus oedipus]
MVGEMETKEKPKSTLDYLMQLMNDKKLMSSLPSFCGIFIQPPRAAAGQRNKRTEGEDSLKKTQLMELAILNGTCRDANIKSPAAQAAPRIITGPAPVLPPAALRTPTPAGPTIMPLIRQIQTAVMPNGTPHPTAAIVPPGPEAGLIYTPYE